jgi:hypothetical protein
VGELVLVAVSQLAHHPGDRCLVERSPGDPLVVVALDHRTGLTGEPVLLAIEQAEDEHDQRHDRGAGNDAGEEPRPPVGAG